MAANIVCLVGLILDFAAFAILREYRDRRSYPYVWATFLTIAGAGSLLLAYAVLSAFNVPDDAAGGFMGLGLLILAFVCLPYLLLLLLCLKYRPARGKK